ncbi:PREDICTED: triadin-like [Acromyrmex echinatior]|uniref:triadin-like n=1 Tax=Acromyrmex echinatior TaxID=103372 RepID=UPI000580D41A|nr:PREDICTED: triadin-like [Acromyrmex echinatior]
MTPKIKRSKSFPNESETTDHAAELEDLLSSRSGLTETSTNKPEIDEDEEEDHWKDASPMTPICSPVRRSAKLHRDKRSPTRYIDVDNDVEIIHEFYPTTSKTMREETSIVSYGGTIIVETTRIPRHTKDVPTRMEKVAPKVKLKKQSSLELDRVPPVQEEPSSSAEDTSRVTMTMRSVRETDQERRKSLKRHSSVESEGRTSTSRETLEKSDTSSEKGAKKKVFMEKGDGKKRSRKSGKKSIKTERKMEEDSSRRKHEGEDFAKKDEETYRRSREESVGLETAELSVPEVIDEQRVKRPSAISKEEETVSLSTTIETSIVSTKRKESLKSVSEVVEETKDSLRDSKLAKDVKRLSEDKKQRPTLERVAVSEIRQPEPAAQQSTKRPSSLRKRRNSFSRESSRESLLEEKKGVRIQEDVQEIFFDDTSDQTALSCY